MDLNKLAELMNSATPEECAMAMEKLSIADLEWAVEFESMSRLDKVNNG